jgi:2-alkyl-3-oxoalkanoate reductase
MRALVSGASGFIVSHLVERLAADGHTVFGLVRDRAKADFVASLGGEPVLGDLADSESLGRAMRSVDTVFHLAAHVSDWGPWSMFEAITVGGTKSMLRAAAAAGVGRFVHGSTVNVYDDRYCRRHRLVTEDAPHDGLGDRTFGHYARSKVMAEEVAWQCHREQGLPLTVVRPAFVYGPRDKTILPRLIDYLRTPLAPYIGGGNPVIDPIYVTDVVECLMAAAQQPAAVGRAYNVAPLEEIGVRDFLRELCAALGIREPKWYVPHPLMAAAAWAMEGAAKLVGTRNPPPLTKAGLSLFSEDRHYTPERAVRELGWSPCISLQEGMARVAAAVAP